MVHLTATVEMVDHSLLCATISICLLFVYQLSLSLSLSAPESLCILSIRGSQFWAYHRLIAFVQNLIARWIQ